MIFAYCEREKKTKQEANIMGKITVSARFLQALSPFINKNPRKHNLQDIMDGIFLF